MNMSQNEDVCMVKNRHKPDPNVTKGALPKMQVGGNRGWNNRNGSTVLFLMICCLLSTTCRSDSKICVLRLDGTSQNCTGNLQQIIVEYGRNTTMFCSLRYCWEERVCNTGRVADLEILLDNKLVKRTELQVVTTHAISMKMAGLPPSKYSYDCRLKLGATKGIRKQYKLIWHTQLIIGFMPKEPRNFKCVSYNSENLVCTWEPVPNFVDTRFSLRFKDLKPVNGKMTFTCAGSQKEPGVSPNSCRWSKSTNSPSRLTDEYYTLVLGGENILGKSEFTYKYHNWAHVIPPKPVKLSVIDTTSSNVRLHWTAPLSLQDFPPGMHYRVLYQRKSDSVNTWNTLDVINETQSTEVYLNLPDLEHDDAVHNVQVYAKSSMAVGENIWSQFSDITFTTTAMSCSTPRSGSGNFEIIGANGNRDVYIYWQTSSTDLENEDETTYHVVGYKENGRALNVKPDVVTKNYAMFKKVGFDSLIFEITNSKCKGASNRKATVHVPSQSAVTQKPDIFIKVALDGGIFQLSWNQPASLDITNYTIFWCEKNQYRPDQCSGEVHWLHVPRDTNIYYIAVPDSKKSYRFAIATNTAQASSGIVWIPDVGKVNSGRSDRIDSGQIETNASKVMEENFSELKDFIKKLSNEFNNALDHKLGEIDVLASTIINSTSEVSSLKLAISALEQSSVNTKDFIREMKERNEAVDRKLNGLNLIKSDVTDSATKVSDLALSISALEQSSETVKEFIREMKERNEAVDSKLDGIDKLDSKITNSATQVTNLTQTIYALGQDSNNLKDFIRDTKKHNGAVDLKLDGIVKLDSKITDSAAEISNLTLAIAALERSSINVTDFINDQKNRNEAIDRKLDGIDVLNSKIADAVMKVSNLAQTISAYKVDLDAVSKENCELRQNLTKCIVNLTGQSAFGSLDPN